MRVRVRVRVRAGGRVEVAAPVLVHGREGGEVLGHLVALVVVPG